MVRLEECLIETDRLRFGIGAEIQHWVLLLKLRAPRVSC